MKHAITNKKPADQPRAFRAPVEICVHLGLATAWGGTWAERGHERSGCYGFSSFLRMIGGCLGQFWPDFLPVVWAQFFEGDNTPGGD